MIPMLFAFLLRLVAAAARREQGLRDAKAARGGRRGPAGVYYQCGWVAIDLEHAAAILDPAGDHVQHRRALS